MSHLPLMIILPSILAFVFAASPSPLEEPGLSSTPGGYWDPGEQPEKAPDNGEQKVLIGAILAPLGVLRTAAGIASYVTAVPSRCQQVWGSNISEDACKGLRIYGLIGTTLGGLMLGTGVVYLSWGLINRHKYQAWKKNHHFAWSPFWAPTSKHLATHHNFGLQLHFRF